MNICTFASELRMTVDMDTVDSIAINHVMAYLDGDARSM